MYRANYTQDLIFCYKSGNCLILIHLCQCTYTAVHNWHCKEKRKKKGKFQITRIKSISTSVSGPVQMIFCPLPHEVRKGDYWIGHRLSVRPSVRPSVGGRYSIKAGDSRATRTLVCQSCFTVDITPIIYNLWNILPWEKIQNAQTFKGA